MADALGACSLVQPVAAERRPEQNVPDALGTAEDM
jgi:hypothetical protein